jgi:DNA-binding NtrC family response regulator
MPKATRPTILIVDDDAMLAESVQSLLERQIPKSTVLRAESAGAAQEILDKQHVDLLLSDFQIAGVDGVDFIKKARQDNQDLRCILMTGYPAVGLAVRAQRDAKVDGLAVKPFDAKQIVGLVKGVLDEGPSGFRYAAPV